MTRNGLWILAFVIPAIATACFCSVTEAYMRGVQQQREQDMAQADSWLTEYTIIIGEAGSEARNDHK